ncbi:MAG: response regulator [bacterium]|nr:response regulator [bacterium]
MTDQEKTILIVEDDRSQLQALVDKLTQEGFATLEAKNGEEGLETALREHPDLILLDIVMPVMDGMTMLKKLREDTWGKDALVIILSNLSDPEKISQAVTQGTYGYLIKTDWKIEDVVAKVKELLSK